MAQGNPLLIAYTGSDRTLRSYELSGGAFVQIGTSSLTAYATPGTTAHAFVRDGQFVVSGFIPSSGNVSAATRYPSLTTINSAVWSSSAPMVLVNPAYDALCALALGTNPMGFNIYRVNASGQLGTTGDNLTASISGVTGSGVVSAGFSPDGELLVIGKVANSESYVLRRTGFNSSTPPLPLYAGTTGTFSVLPVSVTMAASILEWSSDSRFLFHLDRTAGTGVVSVLKRDGTSLSVVGTVSDAIGALYNIRVSPDTRWLAVSYSVSGAPVTIMYRRTGNYLQKMQTFAGTFGSLLDFTFDSAILIDAGNRRAFTLSNGVWSEAVGMLGNVAAAVTVQAVSPHVIYPIGLARLYDGAVPGLVNGTVNLNSLKIALLSDAAVFQQTDAGLATVTSDGANEVSGNGWPAGGKPLLNARKIAGTSTLSLSADAVTQTIVDGTLTFRAAVIYDDSDANKRPVLHIDFQATQKAEPNSEMRIEFDALGFVVFSV